MPSDPLRVAVVCEGPTDCVVIQAALAALVPTPIVVTRVQPDAGGGFAGTRFGEMGTGWKGVRTWCQRRVQACGGLSDYAQHMSHDMLVIHVDADVAAEDEIGCAAPCPPASASADALRKVILRWCGGGSVPDQMVLCIPSKATEAWVIQALEPCLAAKHAPIECHPSPAALLSNRGVRTNKRLLQSGHRPLVRLRNGELKKASGSFREVADDITNAWASVADPHGGCTQAARFSEDARAATSD